MIANWPSVLVLLAAATVTACASHRASESAAQGGVETPPSAAVTSDDPSSRFIGVIGTRAQHAPPFLGVPETNFYCLRSFVDRRTGETEHQLYVSDSYSGPERHWNGAHDAAGRPLRFAEVTRNEITCDGGCVFAEEFAATIPENELRANREGLTVIFTAASGAEKRITVSGGQISAQLAALEARRNPTQPVSAPSAPQLPIVHQ
jgi:hypothetical protein